MPANGRRDLIRRLKVNTRLSAIFFVTNIADTPRIRIFYISLFCGSSWWLVTLIHSVDPAANGRYFQRTSQNTVTYTTSVITLFVQFIQRPRIHNAKRHNSEGPKSYSQCDCESITPFWCTLLLQCLIYNLHLSVESDLNIIYMVCQ